MEIVIMSVIHAGIKLFVLFFFTVFHEQYPAVSQQHTQPARLLPAQLAPQRP